MKRIHVKDDVPYCVIDIYLDQRIFDQAPDRCRSETVLQLLTALPGVEIARAHQTLTIDSAHPDVASQLNIPVHAPTAKHPRSIHDNTACAIAFHDLAYHGHPHALAT